MEHRDYYSREIEKIGKLLRKLFAKISSKNESDPILEDYEAIKKSIKNEINLDLDQFLDTPSDELFEQYNSSPILNQNNLELLVDILIKVSESQESTFKHLLQLKCLDLLELSDENSNEYSLERKNKINWIKERLNKP